MVKWHHWGSVGLKDMLDISFVHLDEPPFLNILQSLYILLAVQEKQTKNDF